MDQDDGGSRYRSRCVQGVFRYSIWDLFMVVEKEKALSQMFPSHLTTRKVLTVVSFTGRGRNRQ